MHTVPSGGGVVCGNPILWLLAADGAAGAAVVYFAGDSGAIQQRGKPAGCQPRGRRRRQGWLSRRGRSSCRGSQEAQEQWPVVPVARQDAVLHNNALQVRAHGVGVREGWTCDAYTIRLALYPG